MSNERTLFARVGVRPDAAQQEIEEAWARRFESSEANHDAIPQEIRDAFRFLRIAENVEHYRQILAVCEAETPIRIDLAQVDALYDLCALTGLRAFADPTYEGMYHLRRGDQKDPWWTQLPSEKPLRPRSPLVRDHVREFVRRFLTLRLFCNTTKVEKLLVVGLYVAIGSGVGTGGKGLYSYASLGFSRLTETEQKRTTRRKEEREAPIRAELAEVRGALKALSEARDRIQDRFRQLTGVSLESAGEKGTIARVGALDLAIIRHESVREAWDDLLAARPILVEVARHQEEVNRIEARIESGVFTNDDDRALREITGWANKRGSTLTSQMSNLEHLRVMLAAERFEQRSQTRERNAI